MEDVISADSTLAAGDTTALSAFVYEAGSALSTLDILVVRRGVLTNHGPADVEIGPVDHGASARKTVPANTTFDLGAVLPSRMNVVNNDGAQEALVDVWLEGEFKKAEEA